MLRYCSISISIIPEVKLVGCSSLGRLMCQGSLMALSICRCNTKNASTRDQASKAGIGRAFINFAAIIADRKQESSEIAWYRMIEPTNRSIRTYQNIWERYRKKYGFPWFPKPRRNGSIVWFCHVLVPTRSYDGLWGSTRVVSPRFSKGISCMCQICQRESEQPTCWPFVIIL